MKIHTGTSPSTDHLGFYVLEGFPLDKSLMSYMLVKYENDGYHGDRVITLFQLGPRVDPQTVHYIHGQIVAVLSRDDPLHLRYIYKTAEGTYQFVYIHNSNPVTAYLDSNPRVILSFAGIYPYCPVCESSLCQSFVHSESFIELLLGEKKGHSHRVVNEKMKKLGKLFRMEDGLAPIPGCVHWMMDYFAKNYPAEEL